MGSPKDRMGSIGASDFGAIIGVSRFKTAHELWLEKTGQVPGFGGNLRTMVGEALELLIISLAAQRLDANIQVGAPEYRPESEPWLVTHPDAMLSLGGETVAFDAKTCGYSKRDGGWGPAGSELVPAEYFVQLQAQMHSARLCGVDVRRGFIGCLFLNYLSQGEEKQPQLFEIQYDEAMCLRLMERGREFWSWVVNKQFPNLEAA